jgi:hypothetical protein
VDYDVTEDDVYVCFKVYECQWVEMLHVSVAQGGCVVCHQDSGTDGTSGTGQVSRPIAVVFRTPISSLPEPAGVRMGAGRRRTHW